MVNRKKIAGLIVAGVLVLSATTYPYLRMWGGPDLERQMSGGVIVGVSEPLRDWELFLWTPR
jgi:hypothetical protein